AHLPLRVPRAARGAAAVLGEPPARLEHHPVPLPLPRRRLRARAGRHRGAARTGRGAAPRARRARLPLPGGHRRRVGAAVPAGGVRALPRAHPLITPSGRRRATRVDSPARCTTSTTASTSL